MAEGRQLELGVNYPIVDSTTQENLIRYGETKLPTIVTPLGSFGKINTRLEFWDLLDSLPGLNPEGVQKLAPWVEKPLGEVRLSLESVPENRTRVHRAPLGLRLVSSLTTSQEEDNALEFLQNHIAKLSLGNSIYELDLAHSGHAFSEGVEWCAGNMRNRNGRTRELLLPDDKERLSTGRIMFV